MKKILISPHYAKQQHILRISSITNLSNFLIDQDYLPIIISANTDILEFNKKNEVLVKNYLNLEPDGIIFTGGSSIDPSFYDFNEQFHCHSQIYRDIFELELCKQAMIKDIPIMGICRGMQLINVVLGGNLKYTSNKRKHALAKDGSIGHNKSMEEMHTDNLHTLKLLPESNIFYDLERIFQKNTAVNSIHFQCINKIATELSLDAYSEDGEIEIVSNISKGILGVQFHPELDTENEVYNKLFKLWLSKV